MEGAWTEEKHASFLNKMEECFVKTMLSARILSHGRAEAERVLRLDRTVPDSETESIRRAAKPISSTKKRRLSSGKNSFQDQVVPEIESPGRDNDSAPKKIRKGITDPDRL